MEVAVEPASRRSLRRFAERARRAAGVRGDVDVLVTSSRRMRALNRRYRGKDRATDVLSFPAAEKKGGDIAISTAIAHRQAARLGHSMEREFEILILHGMLHLAGYDHEHDGGAMARKEERLRKRLGLPAALIARTSRRRP